MLITTSYDSEIEHNNLRLYGHYKQRVGIHMILQKQQQHALLHCKH